MPHEEQWTFTSLHSSSPTHPPKPPPPGRLLWFSNWISLSSLFSFSGHFLSTTLPRGLEQQLVWSENPQLRGFRLPWSCHTGLHSRYSADSCWWTVFFGSARKSWCLLQKLISIASSHSRIPKWNVEFCYHIYFWIHLFNSYIFA